MVHLSRSDKQSVRYRQFQEGYAKVPAVQLRALLEGYRQRIFRRDEVRVFAATWEAAALHRDSKVSLYRILNCNAKHHPRHRRMSHVEIDSAASKLATQLPKLEQQLAECNDDCQWSATTKPVARRVLRHVARGGATTVEALFYFAFFMCRIPQRKPMQRLRPQEHYARFRYADFQEWTGVLRTSQSRLLQRILDRGFLNTEEVHKQNENVYGQLYIDGPMLSLVRPRQSNCRRRRGRIKANTPPPQKMTTPLEGIGNTPFKMRATLINGNPKTEIKRPEKALKLKEGHFACHADAELRRIALRAAQMAEQCQSQAA
ncbi:hypothetical protein [Bythopirellula goksoeyrii]|uniref:Uncharacterized protein n=1 Tax=Bythopirellula goksoeyrii TaxID=1400387 RepID=A0A5B9QIL6_9BACT|nr:hypothetical protein [Bythopirellula goksoeyrii]QEG37365.1 hypothetical protein Pr1d_47070 [Bythopirellula goksoeyrii]